MKQLITFRPYSKIFSCLFISTCLLTSFTVHAQKANKIFVSLSARPAFPRNILLYVRSFQMLLQYPPGEKHSTGILKFSCFHLAFYLLHIIMPGSAVYLVNCTVSRSVGTACAKNSCTAASYSAIFRDLRIFLNALSALSKYGF